MEKHRRVEKYITQAVLTKKYDIAYGELKKACQELNIKPTKRRLNGRGQFTFLPEEFERIMEYRGFHFHEINGIWKWRKTKSYPAAQYTEVVR